MIPLRDDHTRSAFPYVNYSIIALNVAAYEVSHSGQPHARYDYYHRFGATPQNFQLAFSGSREVTVPGVFFTLVTSLFVQGGGYS